MSARKFNAKLVSAIITLLFLLAAVQADESIAVRAPPTWNATASADDFVQQYRKQYNDTITQLERELSDFGKIYVAKFVPLELQIALMEDKLTQADNKLAPLDLLSPLTRHCIRKYRAQLPDKSVVKAKLNACINDNKSRLTSILSSPTNRKDTLKNYYNINVNTNVNNCRKQHTNSAYNYTVCMSGVISSADTYTASQIPLYTSYLYTSECSAKTYINTATECSFGILYSTIGSIHETMYAIDTCIDINANPNNNSPCGGGANNSTRPACENVINLSLKERDFLNATIQNPFYGLNNTTKCLEINFV